MTMDKAVTEILETLIDRHGLLHILTGLELVCSEKAERIQDARLARLWDRAARVCGNAARNDAVIILP